MKAEAKSVDVEAAIAEMVRRIVEKFHPEKIILFGSYARGDATPDSDVDLLVVMLVDGSPIKKEVGLRGAVHGLGVPKDIFVSDSAEFESRKDIIGTIEYPATREGKLLYARS